MTFESQLSEHLRKILRILKRKDHALFITIKKKMGQIARGNETDIEHFKNLRHDLSYLKRVQIGNFVLTFRLKGSIIIFEDFDHHDRIYKKRR
jgi:mRNA-degrading endonuclease RelE of RelBE toxin-antitoxin system